MKWFISGIVVLIVAIGAYGSYFYEARASEQRIENNDQLAKPIVKSSDLGNKIIINNLNDKDGLFKNLYQPVDTNILNQEELESYNVALKNNMMVSYLGTELEAYEYRGVKEYKNNNEPRYIVMFTHTKDAGCISCGNEIDLFLFKKLESQYILIAQTKEGISNSSGGCCGTDNVIYNHIVNADPIDLGKSDKGYIIEERTTGISGNSSGLDIIWLNESSGEIYDIANYSSVRNIENYWHINDDDKQSFDSFYYLDTEHSTNGLYNLNLYKTSLSDKDMYQIFQFNGKQYNLASKGKNKYSTFSNFGNYTKFYSSIDRGGYAPIPYASLIGILDDQIDNWFGFGIRAFKPAEKTKDYFTWKVKGIKLYDLKVLAVQRGVCDSAGEDTCASATYGVILFDEPLEVARAKLLDSTGRDYTKLSGELNSQLDQVEFEGKQRAALVVPRSDSE
jgi:hypothetical protein